jgi:hypothetical protein
MPSSISLTDNIVSHNCWDNFDTSKETPSGSGATHTARGIVMQELHEDESTVTSSSLCGLEVPKL